jgi:hypothetical protein
MYSPPSQLTFDERHRHHIAEVIETSTTGFTAQCLEPDDLSFPFTPPFGSWVKARDEQSDNQIFGVVSFVTTTPIDSLHRARALGLSLAELREQQPQVFAMLKTEFRVAILGFSSASAHRALVHHYLPPRPPQIHQAVYQCAPQEILDFTAQADFLRILLQVNDVPVDALIAAAIRTVYNLRLERPWLVEVGRHLSLLLKDDYDRLRYILSQIQVVAPNRS